MCPTSDTGSVDCCFCEIAPKSNFLCNGLVERRHHYHLVNKKHVLPFGHLELNNNHSLNILATAKLEPIITSFTLATGHFTKYKSSPDMYNGIIFISIKCGVFFVFFIKPHLYCTYVMHISGSFHYLYQLSFFCACVAPDQFLEMFSMYRFH
jgi:hypothetical protein